MSAASLMNLYARTPFEVVSGRGVWLTDANGRTYLDCVQGIATNALGHAHPRLVAALTEQAKLLWHTSNVFRVPGQEELAGRLTDATFADVVFFTNSGTEAVEAALKVARRHHAVAGRAERIDVIGFSGSFHGRTYAAVNASGNPAYLDGFGPRLPGYVQLPIDDQNALRTAIAGGTTAAVIVEPVQGEGGARALSGEWLRRLRECTRAHQVLLIYDEVQSGMGRTGKLFAHQWFEGVEPDIMAVAKALGGGFPIGACLATNDAASGMTIGIHGNTFGGNPLAMAVASAAFDEIARDDTLAAARRAASDFRMQLEGLCAAYPDVITEVRGKGLLLGLKLVPNNRSFMRLAQEFGLLVAGGSENIIRLLPPLTITSEEIAEVIRRLAAICDAARDRLAA